MCLKLVFWEAEVEDNCFSIDLLCFCFFFSFVNTIFYLLSWIENASNFFSCEQTKDLPFLHNILRASSI